MSSQGLHARLDAVPVPASFNNTVETEAVKLSMQAMELVDEVAPVLPSWAPLDIAEKHRWEGRLRIIFSQMLVLKLRLEICYSNYRVIWPNRGGLIKRSEMEQIELPDDPRTPQSVAFPCFPGIETRAQGYGPIVARQAMVVTMTETSDRRPIDTAEMLKAIAYARNLD